MENLYSPNNVYVSWDGGGGNRVMVFNVTFNNISVISKQSVVLVKETEVPGENHKPAQVNDKLY